MQTAVAALREADVAELRGLFKRTTESGHGSVVFLSGAEGSGRTWVLERLQETLRSDDAEPLVLAGSMASGRYQPWGEEPGKAIEEALAVVGSIVTLSSPLTGPIGLLLGQIVAHSKAAHQLLTRLTPKPRDLADVTVELLREAAQEGPLACVIDEVERAGGDWWRELVVTFAEEVGRDLPLFLVQGLIGPRELGEPQPDEEAPLAAARILRERSLAQWRALEPAEASSLEAAFGPIDSAVASEIVALSGGEPEWIDELWQAWIAEGTLTQEHGRWHFSEAQAEDLRAARSLYTRSLREVVGDDLTQLAFADDILAFGALEGRSFTADAVAAALEYDRDELVDFLDDVLAREGSPLLREQGFVEIDFSPLPPRSLCLYAFSSGFIWRLAGELTPERERDFAKRMAEALRTLYAGKERQIAAAVARLYEAAGEKERGSRYQSLIAFGAAPDLLAWQARRLGSSADTLPTLFERQRALYFLFEAFRFLRASIHSDELIEIARAARTIAAGLDDRRAGLRATAFWSAAHGLAEDHSKALVAAREVIAGAREQEDRWLELDGLGLAGNALAGSGDVEAAAAEYRQALELRQQLGGDDSDSPELIGLGKCLASLGEHTEAIDLFDRARAGYERVGDRLDAARATVWLGVTHVLEGSLQGLAQGITLIREALPVFSEFGDLRMEAEALYMLGRFELNVGSSEEGVEMVRRSLALYNEVGDDSGATRAASLLDEAGAT